MPCRLHYPRKRYDGRRRKKVVAPTKKDSFQIGGGSHTENLSRLRLSTTVGIGRNDWSYFGHYFFGRQMTNTELNTTSFMTKNMVGGLVFFQVVRIKS